MAEPQALFALLYFIGINAFALACPYTTWHRLIRAGEEIDAALPMAFDRAAIVAWLQRESRPALWFSIYLSGGAIATVVSIFLLAPALDDRIDFGVGSHLTIFLSTVVFLENAHWVLRLPTLIVRITALRVKTLWHDPAATPVFQSLTRLLGWTAILGLVGGVALGLPILYAYALNRSISVAVIALVPPVAMLATFIYTGLRPQYAVYRAVSRAKQRTFELLQKEWPGLGAAEFPGSQTNLLDGLQVWRHLSDAPSWIVTRDTVVQYGAASATTVVAAVISILLAIFVD